MTLLPYLLSVKWRKYQYIKLINEFLANFLLYLPCLKCCLTVDLTDPAAASEAATGRATLIFTPFTRYRYNVAQVLSEILRDELSDGDDSGDCAEIVTFALSSTVSEILPVLYAHTQFFRTPLLFRLKLGGAPLK